MDWTISSSWLTAERNPATVEILLNPDERFWQERLGAAPAINLSLFDIHMQRELDRHFRGDLTRCSKSVL